MQHRAMWRGLAALGVCWVSLGCMTAGPDPVPVASGGTAGSGGSAAAGAPSAGSAQMGGAPGMAGQGGTPPGGGGTANAQAGNAVGGSAVGGASMGGSGGNVGGVGGSSGSGGQAPSAGCRGSTFALCDDFEGGAIDSNLWKLSQSKGTITLDAARGARGSKTSAHVHVDAGSDTMVGLIATKTFPALKAALFARAFVYIPSANTSMLFMGDRHSRLIYAQGQNPYGEYALGIWNGGLIQNHYSKTDDSVDTKMLPPFDTWFCLEYELDSAAGNVKAYLDDAEITALRHNGWPAANIDQLMFGVDRYGSFPVAEDIWFDDVVVDSARIGCVK